MPKRKEGVTRPDREPLLRLAGQRIREIRERANLSQAEVADMVGVTQTAWSRWEVGDRTPDSLAIIQFCNCFRVSLDFIYLGNPANTHPQLKETPERRVDNLPPNLVERLRAYQTENAIASETEAVRRLLETALQLNDSVRSLLRQLRSRYAEERNLRLLSTAILGTHALVKAVQFGDGGVTFEMSSGDRGRIDRHGKTFEGDGNGYDSWKEYPEKATRRTGGSPSWEPLKADLDDEIPF